jgi:hypothetical protein
LGRGGTHREQQSNGQKGKQCTPKSIHANFSLGSADGRGSQSYTYERL